MKWNVWRKGPPSSEEDQGPVHIVHFMHPETPRVEHTGGIEPDTWLGQAGVGFQAGGLTTRPDMHGLGDGTNLANLGRIVGIWGGLDTDLFRISPRIKRSAYPLVYV